jgi:hypothetical protein
VSKLSSVWAGGTLLLTLFAWEAAAAEGFSSTDNVAADAAAQAEAAITDYDRQHWAFAPLLRPGLPAVTDVRWCYNAIDRFVLASLEDARLQPLPPASRQTLIRRVTFDLLGLPPAPEDVARFVSDPSPLAYELLVDRLLASPRYGERWAQFWLDLARFAETDGYEFDKRREQAWRYRDWVIRAFNRDLPYDTFVKYQLAGDELWPDQEDGRVATAFCLSGPDMPDINSQEERRHTLLNEMTATVGQALLGLQIGCAQCHDHKYDPISQADFYRLRAVFEPAIHPQRDVTLNTLCDSPPTAVPSYLWVRGDFRRPGPAVRPGLPRIANPWNTSIANTPSGRRSELAAWITRADHPLTGRVIVNRLWQFHFGRGLTSSPSDLGVMGQPPSHPELLDWLAGELTRQAPSANRLVGNLLSSKSRRRTGLVPRDMPACRACPERIDGT